MDYPKGASSEERYQAELEQEVNKIKAAADAIKVRLTPAHRDLISFVEQYWYTNQSYPSDSALARYANSVELPMAEIKVLQLDVTPYLTARGIDPPKNGGRLSPEQLAAANLVMNFADKRSKQNKLNSIGVTVTQWDGWCRSKPFQEYLKNRTGTALDDNLHTAHGGLIAAVERGEASALKLYYEMTGLLQKDSPQANVNVIFAMALEAIQRVITDRDTLIKIGAEFEQLMLRMATLGTPVAASSSSLSSSSSPVEPKAIASVRDEVLDSITVETNAPVAPVERHLDDELFAF